MLTALLDTTIVTAASKQFEPPTIDEFFPPSFPFLDGTILEGLNRINMVQLIALIVLVLLLGFFAARSKVVPSKGQLVVEFILGFAQKNIAEEVLGPKLGRKYAPLITTIFLMVLFFNLTGIVPGLNIAGSAQVAVPIVLAAISWVVFVGSGFKYRGMAFLKDALFPPGVPKPAYILLTPLEFISTFILRPFTLVIRLLANMVSGHMLLALCFISTNFLLIYADTAFKAFGVLTFASALVMICFEVFIACLQAYIFAILTTVYINLSVHSH
ncbi:MAG: F0F1 ATP synthase subunit A [Varibaculum sp.]|nr:F0F1 ATP synthase subunit A [Varibaculum sp.]